MRAPAEPLPRRRRSILGPALFTLFGVAILCGLGTWQIKRLAWKQGLIDTLHHRLGAPAGALPDRPRWPQLDAEHDEFRRVRFHAEVANGREALVYTSGSAFRPDVSGSGYWVFAPAKLADGGTVVVNLGFVPEGRQDGYGKNESEAAAPVDIVGVMRWPEEANWLTPPGDPGKNMWFARDHLAMAAAKGWGPVAPFYIDQETPVPPGGLPRPGPLIVQLRNEHLQYAVTWYGLALALAVMFGVWVYRRGRASA